MSKIGLVDVDRFTFTKMTFPNLPLMKISAYHRLRGDTVSFCQNPLERYDKVYQTKVFDSTYTPDIDWIPNADEVERGGSGYKTDKPLPDNIEHIYPDYTLYGIEDVAYGFLTRGCPRGCPWCIVGEKEGRKSVQVAELNEFWRGQKFIKLLDPNLTACRDATRLLLSLAESGAWVDFTQGLDARLLDEEKIEELNRVKVKTMHFAWDDPRQDLSDVFERLGNKLRIKDRRRRIVYVLTNFGSTHEEDLWRIETLERFGFDPDVRIFDKPNAPQITRDLQRWCNNRIIHGACKSFDDYKRR